MSCVCLLGQDAWKHAIEKAKAMPDPWAQFHLEEIKTEPCIRYRYDKFCGCESPDGKDLFRGTLTCHSRKSPVKDRYGYQRRSSGTTVEPVSVRFAHLILSILVRNPEGLVPSWNKNMFPRPDLLKIGRNVDWFARYHSGVKNIWRTRANALCVVACFCTRAGLCSTHSSTVWLIAPVLNRM